MPQYPPGTPVAMNYANIVNAGTTIVKAAPADLQSITINSTGGTATAVIYDNVTATGTVLVGSLNFSAATAPVQIKYELSTKTGLAIISTGTINATVVYK